MSEIEAVTVTFELVGSCHISVVTRSENGIHRRSVLPGSFVDGVWVDTDLSEEPADLLEFADEVWIEAAVEAFKEANRPLVRPVAPYWLYKSTFIMRLTDAEAGMLEIALMAAEPKLRLMYNSVEYFVSDNNLFLILHGTIALALRSSAEAPPNFARADQLLAEATIEEAALQAAETA